MLRILRCENIDVTADDYSEQIAESLEATYTESPFVEIAEQEPHIDTSQWGPQVTQLKSMLSWASRHYFAAASQG